MRRHRPLAVVPLLALFLAFFLCALTTQHAYAAATIHVKPNGNSGSPGAAWSSATTLHHAITIAQAGDQIWVASGIYTPGVSINDTFTLTAGVALYGGFAATETLLTQRDWIANPTILSGDIGGDDDSDAHGITTSPADIHGSNSRRVVNADGTNAAITSATRLDGFTITGGDSDYRGGGMVCSGVIQPCDPTIEHVIFRGNRASDSAGAFYNYGQSGDSSPSLTDVTFISNSAAYLGGALFNDGGNSGHSSPTLTNVTFISNSSTTALQGRGGAVFNNGSSGGDSRPTFTNVTFSGNSATYVGGAVYNFGNVGVVRPTFINASFSDNRADSYGGAIYDDGGIGDSSPTLINVLFSHNSAGQDGGALYHYGGGGNSHNPRLVNVTFNHNHADGKGGALYNNITRDSGAGGPVLTNVILWNDSAITSGAEIENNSATVTFTTSLVQGGINGSGVVTDGTHAVVDGGGNLSANPLFVNEANANLRLKAASPAIDKGANSAITQTTDLDGNPRKVDGDGDHNTIVDIGAYEFQNSQPLTITFAGSGGGLVDFAPAGAPCSAPCQGIYLVGTSVTLTATAHPGSTFSGWGGACSGTGSPPGTCHLTIDNSNAVIANFSQNHYTITTAKSGTGSGTISKTPAAANYLFGTVVTLTASAAATSTFSGWSGDCTGATCVLTMDANKQVTAAFTAKPNHAPSFISTASLSATVGQPYTYTVTTHDPGAGDTLTLSAPTKPAWLTLTTTGNGTATLTGTPTAANLGANAVQLRVQDQKSASASQSFTITVVAAATPPITQTGSIQGKVQDEQNQPLAGATVTLTPKSSQLAIAAAITQTTDGEGNYLFADLPPGNYTVTASMSGKQDSAPVTVTVHAGETSTVGDITLQPALASKPQLHLPLLANNP